MAKSPVFTLLDSVNGALRAQEHPALRLTEAEDAADVTPVNFAYPPYDVRRYGADPSGENYSHEAFQVVADLIANAQGADFPTSSFRVTEMIIPDGVYRFNGVVKFHGMVSILCAGPAWAGGVQIIQEAESTNIFEFYGDLHFHQAGGAQIEGISFGFDTTSVTGYALCFPKFDDIVTSNLVNSNSIYIRNCRFGTFYPNGGFLVMHRGNDIEITSNIIDVCYADDAILLGDSTDTTAEMSDVRITNNGFFFTRTTIRILRGQSILVANNSFFFTVLGGGITKVNLLCNVATPVAGAIRSVQICNNTFEVSTIDGFDEAQQNVAVDGGCFSVAVDNNSMYNCSDYALSVANTDPVIGLSFRGNKIHLNADYPRATVCSASAQMQRAAVGDNQIFNASDTAVVNLFGDLSGGTPFDADSIIRPDTFEDAGLVGPKYYLPMAAEGVVFRGSVDYGTSYPTNSIIFHLGTFASGDWANFRIDYEAEVDQTGVDFGLLNGTSQVNIVMASSVVSNIASLSSIGQAVSGTAGNVPTVTFNATVVSSVLELRVTISSSIASPTAIRLKYKIYDCHGRSNVIGKVA